MIMIKSFSSSCGKEKKLVKKAPKPTYGRLWGIQIQKVVISNPKQPSCKKSVAPEKPMVKKDVKSKVAAKKCCDGRLMVKILITAIQVNFVLASNSPDLSLLKFLLLTYHHSHFLATTLDFEYFFILGFLGAALFFTTWLFWIR